MGEKDPLYGIGDPLAFSSDLFLDNGKNKNKKKDPFGDLLFADPMSTALKKENKTDSDEFEKTGTEEGGSDDEEDWMSSAPPLDYLERVKVGYNSYFDKTAKCTLVCHGKDSLFFFTFNACRNERGKSLTLSAYFKVEFGYTQPLS